MEKKLDLRVIKTRNALTKSLYDLMCEKNFGDITVTELCERALVRKATFYKHFGDKSELLIYMIRELQSSSLESGQIVGDPDNPISYYVGVFAYFINFIDENRPFIDSVLKSGSIFYVRDILEEQIRLDIDDRLKREARQDLRDSHSMLSSIYAGAIVSCGVWWVGDGGKTSKKQLLEQFARFTEKM
ncbi:MAG: TetR/AcrR family transcriptional regulator [Bacillota bacterium]|nr:TetR/AcrR family transcriptional regulator [Bacillota bacterium]